MHGADSQSKRYLLAALLGALGGGLVVALATRAVPRMASQIMAGRMRDLCAGMREDGCDPAQI